MKRAIQRLDDGGAVYGLREDGTPKGKGYFGELRRPDGDFSTELSLGVNMGGKEALIPSLVPGLTQSEIDHLLKDGQMTNAIADKAVAHARQRQAAGLSVWAQPGEQNHMPAPMPAAPGFADGGSVGSLAEDIDSILAGRQVAPPEERPAQQWGIRGRGTPTDFPIESPDEHRRALSRSLDAKVGERPDNEGDARAALERDIVRTQKAISRAGPLAGDKDAVSAPAAGKEQPSVGIDKMVDDILNGGATAQPTAAQAPAPQPAAELGPNPLTEEEAARPARATMTRGGQQVIQGEPVPPVPAPAPGFTDKLMAAARGGAASTIADLAQSANAVVKGKDGFQQPTEDYAKELTWGDLKDPTSAILKSTYQIAHGAPVLTAGFLGAVGGQAAFPEAPGIAALAGGTLAASAMQTAQALGPYYAAELQAGLDPDKALDAALKKAGTAGAFTAVGWAAFGFTPFKGTVQNLLMQAFGIQPAVSAAQRAVSNVQADRPATEGLGEDYPASVIGTILPLAGIHGAKVSVARAQERPGPGVGTAFRQGPAEPAAGALPPADEPPGGGPPAPTFKPASKEPTHRLDDGTLVSAATEDGKTVPGVWITKEGQLVESPYANPVHGPDPNGEWVVNGVHYDVAVTGKGKEPGTAQLADGQTVPITELHDLNDEAKITLGLAEPEEKKVAGRASAAPQSPPSSSAEKSPAPAATVKKQEPAPVRAEKPAPAEPAQPAGPAPKLEGAQDLQRQNRMREGVASVAQMNQIANAPDYDRLSFSKAPETGAPMVSVAGNQNVIPAEQLGRTSVVTIGGEKVPVQYAVVPSSMVLASHDVSGNQQKDYFEAPTEGQVRALNNGRAAGLKAAFDRGTAAKYVEMMTGDPDTGIDPKVISKINNPMLVRVYPDEFNSKIANIGQASQGETLGQSPLELALQDAQKLTSLEHFDPGESGSVSSPSNAEFVKQFLQTVVPEAQRGSLFDPTTGKPNKAAYDRIEAAVFQKAYGSKELTGMFAEAADPEIRAVLHGLSIAAPEMAKLEGAPEILDVRPYVSAAAQLILAAKRAGTKLSTYLKQQDIEGRHPFVQQVAEFMAGEIRAPRRMAEGLRAAAKFVQFAIADASTGDMFGDKPTYGVKHALDALNKFMEENYGKSADDLLSARPAEGTRPERTESSQAPPAKEQRAGQLPGGEKGGGVDAERKPEAAGDAEAKKVPGPVRREAGDRQVEGRAEYLFDWLNDWIKKGEGDAGLVDNDQVENLKSLLRADGWVEKKIGKNVDWLKDDWMLFFRSQGQHSGTIVQWGKQDGVQAAVATALAKLPEGDQEKLIAKAEMDVAAGEAHPNPTGPQKEAGNYQKGHITWNGLDLSIENARGETRSAVDGSWSREMPHHYGYVRGTEDRTGEHVDFFMGPNPESDKVFLIEQEKPNGRLDEPKAMLGFDSEPEAVQGYKDAYPEGWKVGPVVAQTVDTFKHWLAHGDTTRRPSAAPLAELIPNIPEFLKGDAEAMYAAYKRGDVDAEQWQNFLTETNATASYEKRGVKEAKQDTVPYGRPPIQVMGSLGMPEPREIAHAGDYDNVPDEHQMFAINLALTRFEAGGRAFMLADGTGVGKTLSELIIADQMLKQRKKPVLIITQNKQIFQNNFTDDALKVGIDLKKFELGTYIDLRRQKAGLGDYSLVVFDECFPKGTSVATAIGPTLIEDVQVGDSVHTPFGIKRVTQRWRRERKRDLIEVRHEHGSLRCTANHRVYSLGRGWVQAGSLTERDVLVYAYEHDIHQKMRVLRREIRAKGYFDNAEEKTAVLQHLMSVEGSMGEAGICGDDGGDGTGTLAVGHATQSGTRRKNDESQPILKIERATQIVFGSPWQTVSRYAGRQWPWIDRAAEVVIQAIAWMVSGISGLVRSDDFVAADGCGFGSARSQVGGGVRRPLPPFVRRQSERRIENETAQTPGLDGYSLLEQGDFGEHGIGACGYRASRVRSVFSSETVDVTYDLEVEGDHCYFADGVLVSNSHNMKNMQSDQSAAGRAIKADHRMFATATPMDKPVAASYFMSAITGMPEKFIQDSLGFKVNTIIDMNGQPKDVPVLIKGHTWPEVLNNIVRLRDRAIKAGSMIRREYPFYGTMEEPSVPFVGPITEDQKKILRYWDDKISFAQSKGLRTLAMNYAGQKTLETKRWTESTKTGWVMAQIKNELAQGRSVAVMAENYSLSLIKGLDREVRGIIAQLAQEMSSAGIPFAMVTGKTDKAHEVRRFQNNEVPVLQATPQSGGTGIDLDDSKGGHPRTLIVVSPNFSGDVYDQMLGRVSRRNTKTPAKVIFGFYDNSSFGDARGRAILHQKAEVVRKIQHGEDADLAVGFQIDPESDEPERPAQGTPKIYTTNEPWVQHVTKRGNELTGVIAKDLSRNQAQAIDPYTFTKDGGFFIREEYVRRPVTGVEQKGASYDVSGYHPQVPLELGVSPVPALGEVMLGNVVVHERRGVMASPVNQVASAYQAASAVRDLAKLPQENFVALVSDAGHTPIAVLRLGIGTSTEVPLHPWIVAGAVLNVPGAKHVWFAHQHPSHGKGAAPSNPDLNLYDGLENLLKDGPVSYMGGLVISGDKYSVHRQDAPYHNYSQATMGVAKASAKYELPMMERVFERRAPLTDAHQLLIPPEFRYAIRQLGERPGVIFTDAQATPVAFVPMTAAEMERVRPEVAGMDSRASSLLRVAETSNSYMAFIYQPDPNSGRNLASFLNAAGVDVRDMTTSVDGQTEKEKGNAIHKPVYFSAGEREGGMSVDEAAKEIAGNALTKDLGAGLRIVDSPLSFPQHILQAAMSQGYPLSKLKGVYDPVTRTAYVAAANNAPGEASTTVLHERIGHEGLQNVLGKEFQSTMRDIYNQRAGEIRKELRTGLLKDYAFDLRKPAHQADAAAEWLARKAERGEEQSLWQKVVAWVRAQLRKLGFVKNWTNGDILRMFKLSRESIFQGGAETFNGEPAWSLNRSSPVWRSTLGERVSELGPKKATAEEWKKFLSGLPARGVKADEIQWSGLPEWLDLQSGAVSKAQVADYLAGNGVQVTETMLGGADGAHSTSKRDEAMVALDALGYDLITAPGVDGEDYLQGLTRRSDGKDFQIDDLQEFNNLPTEVQQHVRTLQQWEDTERDPEGATGTKFSQYTLPGGENYRELLLTLPAPKNEYGGHSGIQFSSSHFDEPNILAHVRFNERTDADGKRVLFIEEIQSDWAQQGKRRGFTTPEEASKANALDERINKLRENGMGDTELREFFKPGRIVKSYGGYDRVIAYHPGTPDPNWKSWSVTVEAVRLKRDRSGPESLFFDSPTAWESDPRHPGPRNHMTNPGPEVVSQLRQERNRLGNQVAQAPFVGKTEAWVGLALKRMIRYAADEGFDRVAWTNGDQQADRYDLSKHVDAVRVAQNDDGTLTLSAQRKGHRGFDALASRIPVEKASDYVGKELGEKIRADIGIHTIGASNFERLYHGLDLKVGGEGMRQFYDKIVPNVANDVLKKLGGGRVGDVKISEPLTAEEKAGAPRGVQGYPEVQPGFDITDAMRDNAQRGVPMFSLGANPKSVSEIYGVKDGRLMGHASRLTADGAWDVKLATGSNETLFAKGQFRRAQASNLAEVQRMFNEAGLELRFNKPQNTPVPDRTIFDEHWVAPQADNWMRRSIIYFQNRLLLPRIYEEAIAKEFGPLAEEVKAHREARLADPRAAAIIADADQQFTIPLVRAMSNGKIGLKDSGDYLYARHAPEANARIEEIDPDNKAGSGMYSTREEAVADGHPEMDDAESVMAQLRKDPVKFKALEEVGRIADAINTYRENLLIEKGLATPEHVAQIRRYKHYVPLKDIVEDEYANLGVGGGFQVGRLLNSRLGRFTRAQSQYIVPGLVAQMKGTIAAGEHAEVLRALLRLVQSAPNPAIWKEVGPTFQQRAIDPATGMLGLRQLPIQMNNNYATNIIGIPVAGKKHYIQITDPRFVEAYKSSGMRLNEFVQLIGKATRYYALMATGANPEFMGVNFIRDFQEAMIRISGEESPGLAAKVAKDAFPAMWGAWKGIRAEGQIPEQPSHWHRWYRRANHAGSYVAYRGMGDVQTQHQDFLLRLADAGIYPEGVGMLEKWRLQAHRAASLTRAKDVLGVVTDLNGAVENALRLSAFKNYVVEKMGKLAVNIDEKYVDEHYDELAASHPGIVKDAAMLARDVTIDFNLQGTGMPWIKALYMFTNPNVQGIARNFRATMNSRLIKALTFALFLSGITLDWWNRRHSKKDKSGKSYYDEIPTAIKEKNYILMGPDGQNPITIPVTFFFGAFHAAGVHLGAVLDKAEKPTEAGAYTLLAFLNSLNPVGQTPTTKEGILQLFSPTITDLPVQAITNRNAFEQPIVPDRPKFMPPQSKAATYFQNTPSQYVNAADRMNRATGGNEVRSGAIDISPDMLRHWTQGTFGSAGAFYERLAEFGHNLATGKETETRDIPFARRFYYEPKDFELSHRFYDNLNQAEVAHYEVEPTMQHGDRQQSKELQQDNRGARQMYGEAVAAERAIAESRKLAAEIRQRKGMTDDQKKKAGEQLDQRGRDIMQGFNARFEQRAAP